MLCSPAALGSKASAGARPAWPFELGLGLGLGLVLGLGLRLGLGLGLRLGLGLGVAEVLLHVGRQLAVDSHPLL